MLGAGVGKTFHLAPQRVLSMFEGTYHLDQQMTMIGLGELLCVGLLLVPWTLPYGILMVSAYWGARSWFTCQARSPTSCHPSC